MFFFFSKNICLQETEKRGISEWRSSKTETRRTGEEGERGAVHEGVQADVCHGSLRDMDGNEGKQAYSLIFQKPLPTSFCKQKAQNQAKKHKNSQKRLKMASPDIVIKTALY